MYTYVSLKNSLTEMNLYLRVLAEKFIGWPRYSHEMWQNEVYFCCSSTTSISVAVFRSHWEKKYAIFIWLSTKSNLARSSVIAEVLKQIKTHSWMSLKLLDPLSISNFLASSDKLSSAKQAWLHRKFSWISWSVQ